MGQAAFDEKAPKAPDDSACGPLDLGVGRRREAAEADRTVWLRCVRAVEHDRVEMKVEIESIPKSLDEGHAPAFVGCTAVSKPSSVTQRREHAAHEQLQHLRGQLRVVSQFVTQSDRQRENPLPHGDLREYAVHEERSRVGHATPAARRAETSPLTRKPDEPIMTTPGAPYAHEAVRENAAFEITAELALDERGNATTAALGVSEKGP